MKIFHITASYKPAYIYGGPIQSVAKLCESLVMASDKRFAVGDGEIGINDIQVLTTTANGIKELNVKICKPVLVEGVPVTYFKRWTKDHSHFSPGLLINLRKVLRQAQHDKDKTVVHIHAWWNLVSVLSCLIAKWYNIPVVLSPRGMLTSYTLNNRNSFSKELIHKLLGKKLLKYCHIHATSEQEKRDILKIVKPKSITLLPNLVKIKRGVSDIEHQVSRRNLRLIFLSRIEEKKGLDLLLEALALTDISWSLTIAGTGDANYVESLKLKAEILNLNHRIEWLGQVLNEDKFDLLSSHDLCVLTSYNENFAHVVVESLSVGTAVLLSDQVGLSDYVREKDLGWITGLNIEEISQYLKKIKQDKIKLNLIKTTALQIIRTDFDDEVLVEKYLELYDNILRFHSK